MTLYRSPCGMCAGRGYNNYSPGTGRKFQDCWFEERRAFFRKGVAEPGKWLVSLKTYDTRCRLRVSQLFGMNGGYESYSIDGIDVMDRPALDALMVYIDCPSAERGPLPTDRDWR